MSAALKACECVVIGGGAIGLSIAYELAGRGAEVALLDRIEPGRETSWAGAGILPPAPTLEVQDPIDQLRQLAMSLHAQWADRLLQETQIATGFRRCGGIYAAFTPGERAALVGFQNLCQEQGIEANRLSPSQLVEREPAIDPAAVLTAIETPQECQLRNPWHLRALLAACQQRGVQVRANEEVHELTSIGNRQWRIRTAVGEFVANQVCVAAGAWSQGLLRNLGIELGLFPMRGQIVLYKCEQPPFRRILNVGPRYLVPREDGHVLVGSTEEEVGFDKRTTEEAIHELKTLAESLVPALREAVVERAWAGLRPATFDSLPYMGEAPDRPGLFVAAGHFRSGLYLSPAVAVLLADLISGQAPSIDLWPFRISRG